MFEQPDKKSQDMLHELVAAGAAIVEAPEPPAFIPNAGQALALEKLSAFLADPKAFEFGLFGFAGTGKTTVIQQAFSTYEGRVAMSAPTHKAVGILGALADEKGLSVQVATLHKMLSLKQMYKDGEKIFVPDPKRVPMIQSFNVLVIDECSMIGAELDALVRPYIDGERVKIIWMGDRLQLPPVGDETEARAFSAPLSHTLTEIMRNGGVVGKAVADIRDDITAPYPALARPGIDDRGSVEVYGSKLWFRKFMSELESENAEDVQALAFTNKAVDWINASVRAQLFGRDADPFVVGERLVAVETYSQGATILFYTGAFCTVVKATLSSETFVGTKIPCWELEVDLGGLIELVSVLDINQKPAYFEALKKAKAQGLGPLKFWGDYYDLKEAFADLRAGYATTIHKSQGSTYDSVYLAQSDVMKSAGFNAELRNRLLYVGYSRTKTKLVLC